MYLLWPRYKNASIRISVGRQIYRFWRFCRFHGFGFGFRGWFGLRRPSCSWGWGRTWDVVLFLLYYGLNFKITTFCASVRNTWIKIKWQLEILWQTCHGTPHQMYYAIRKKNERKLSDSCFEIFLSRKCVLFWFHGKFIIVSKIDFEFVSIT